jgi:hypothetical protein
MEFENRESERKDTLNLLDYVVIDKSGKKIERAMARTLNVSERGILLETHLALEKGQLLLITIGLRNDLFEVKGVIVRADQSGPDTFTYGIEFLGVKDENIATLRRFLKEFKENHPPAK